MSSWGRTLAVTAPTVSLVTSLRCSLRHAEVTASKTETGHFVYFYMGSIAIVRLSPSRSRIAHQTRNVVLILSVATASLQGRLEGRNGQFYLCRNMGIRLVCLSAALSVTFNNALTTSTSTIPSTLRARFRSEQVRNRFDFSNSPVVL